MKMQRKYVIRRRVTLAIVVTLLTALFTYTTRDTCYVGQEHGNVLGYGSCMDMIDRVVNP